MKVIQSLARYFPDKCGGIQVNLSDIIPQLQSQDINVKIAAARIGTQKEDIYNFGGVEVYRYPIFPTPKTQPNHGQFPPRGFPYFSNWLASQKANIYHQHHWEVLCGLPHLRFAKELGMATVVTIHYPLPVCQRTTLMLNGQEACDGKIDIVRCSSCCDSLAKNLPAPMLKILSQMPMSIVSRLKLPESAYLPASVHDGAIGRFVRPLVVPGYIAARKQSLLEMAKFADRIILVSNWLYEVFVLNGVPKEKLIVCSNGISDVMIGNLKQIKERTSPLKVVFLGRWDASKGIDILVQAVKDLPANIAIELVIHGIAQDEKYRKTIMQMMEGEPRIRIAKQLTREELPSVLPSYDVMAVPSQWFEACPLVVLEAHACGLPVIGSNLGGVAEFVKHGIDGLLVSPKDTKAWTEALVRLCTDGDLLYQLRQGIKPVRSISMQARQVAGIYRNILGGAKNASSLG